MNLIFVYKKIQIKGVEFILKKKNIYDFFFNKTNLCCNCKQRTSFQEGSFTPFIPKPTKNY